MDSLLDKLVCEDLLPHRSYGGGYAREWAGYKHALRRVAELDPGIVGGPGVSALSEMDEAAVALVNPAWRDGARVGAAFARAEDELDAPWHVACGGAGYVTADGEWVRG